MKVVASSKGSFKGIKNKFNQYDKIFNEKYFFERYAELGLQYLKENTPIDSGDTANAWSYLIKKEKGKITINYYNDNTITTSKNNFVPIVILLQYGHATKDGIWVEGRDFINPAMQKVFDQMVFEIANELKNA